MAEIFKKWLPSKRKLIQLYCALLYNANIKGFLSGNIYTGQSKQFCVPGLNCYSCPGAVAACPLGSLQGAFSANRSTLYYVGGILLLYGIFFGRMICGWFCPFGLVQELLYKIKTPKLKKSGVTRILSCLKYVILAVFVFLIPVLYAFKDTPLPAFCKYICPAGTFEGGMLLLANKVNSSYFSMLGPIFTWKFLLMVSITVGCVFMFRLFCRFLCPLGAIYGLFNRLSLFGIQVNQKKCIDCGLCISGCKCDIAHVGDPECISCGECIDLCPTQAISFKGGKILLKANETSVAQPERAKKLRSIIRAMIAALMATVLMGTLVHYRSEEIPAANPGMADTERGNEVGDLCYGYDLQIIDNTGILTKTVDPTATGKITVINFWGTWCTPCVNELPYFQRIAKEYADTVSVIAIHSNLASETAPGYIDQYYSNSNIIFARDYPLDEAGLVGGYYSSLGGRGTYPYTVVLGKDGRITSIFHASVTYEMLKDAVNAPS